MKTTTFTSTLSEQHLNNIFKHRSEGSTKRLSARAAKLPPVWGTPGEGDECEITTWCTPRECCELLNCGDGKWSILCWPKDYSGPAS